MHLGGKFNLPQIQFAAPGGSQEEAVVLKLQPEHHAGVGGRPVLQPKGLPVVGHVVDGVPDEEAQPLGQLPVPGARGGNCKPD